MLLNDKFKKIYSIFIYIIIWFIIFDSARNYTYLPSWFGYIKDAIIYFLGFVMFLNYDKIKSPKKIGKAFYFMLVIVLFCSWFGMLYSNNIVPISILVCIFKYFEFFILFFIFTNLDWLTTIKYDKYIKFYILLSIILVFVNIFGYFVPNNIVSIYITKKFDNGYYRNRITVGQPAISVFPMIISYFYLLIIGNKGESARKHFVKMLILLVGILISISTTGILSLVFCMMLLLFISLYFKKKELLNNIGKIFGVFFIAITVGLIFVKAIPSLNAIYEEQKELLSIKVRALFTDSVTDNSMETRDNNFELALSTMDNPFKVILGVGKYGYRIDNVDVNNLENTYRIFYVEYGLIGLCIFAYFFISHIGKRTILVFRNNNTNKYLVFALLFFIIVAMHAYTLDILYCPTISYTTSFIYCYLMLKGDSKDEDSIN